MTDDGDVARERPQVWHQHRLAHSVNAAWLGEEVSAEHMYALEDAWDVLVVRPEWRAWVRDTLVPEQPFLYLAVDDVPRRQLRKTPSGASSVVPTSEVVAAAADDALVPFFVDVIHDLYVRWALGHGHPAPPEASSS